MTKKHIFELSKWGVYVAALFQLAISQIHIKVITRVFEPSVGFFLFLFVVFGVVMVFNASSLRSGSRIAPFIFGAVVASLMGIFYIGIILLDIRQDNLLTFGEAQGSIFTAAAVLIVYVTATVGMLVTRNYNEH